MKNLKKTLNAIAAQDSSGPQISGPQGNSCCEALYLFNRSSYMMSVTSALDFLIGATPPVPGPGSNPFIFDPAMPQYMSNVASAKKYLTNGLKNFYYEFMDKICNCLDSSPAITLDKTGMFTQVTRPSNLSFTQQANLTCFDKLARMFGKDENQFVDVHRQYFPASARNEDLFIKVFAKMMIAFAKEVSRSLGITNIENSSYLYIIRKLCDDRKRNPVVHKEMVESFMKTKGYVYGAMLYEQALLIPRGVDENVYVGCPPSPNDNSIVALAAALGVTTAVAALAYNAITRGKAKKCSDLATSSSRLTPLIIAAVGGSFATTQTSEATVQEKLQAVMQKECEGRLPYSCGDGGFEGPDEGDGSGEVDAPGGGGGIEGGML